MAFTPTPESSMPTPDAVLAQLQPEPSDPDQTKGYITPDDIEFGWQVFLSRLAHHDTALQALQAAQAAVVARVTALEAAGSAGSAQPQFLRVASETSLPAGTDGALLLAEDTGQWFVYRNGTWNRLGWDTPTVVGNVGAALSRIQSLTQLLDALTSQTVLPYSPSTQYPAGSVVSSGGKVWQSLQQVQGTTPSANTPAWASLTLPDLAEKVRQALAATGASGNLPAAADPADDGKVLVAQGGKAVWGHSGLSIADITGSDPVDYDATHAYADGDIIRFQGSYYVAKSATTAGQDPTTHAGKWLALDIDAIALKAAHAANQNDDLTTRMVAVEAKNTQQDTDIAAKASTAVVTALAAQLPPAAATPADDGKVLTAAGGHAAWQPAARSMTGVFTFTRPSPSSPSTQGIHAADVPAGSIFLRQLDNSGTVVDQPRAYDVNQIIVSSKTVAGADFSGPLSSLPPGSVILVEGQQATLMTQKQAPVVIAYRVTQEVGSVGGMRYQDDPSIGVLVNVEYIGWEDANPAFSSYPAAFQFTSGEPVAVTLLPGFGEQHASLLGRFTLIDSKPDGSRNGVVFFAKADDTAATKPSEAAWMYFYDQGDRAADTDWDPWAPVMALVRVGDVVTVTSVYTFQPSTRYRVTSVPQNAAGHKARIGVVMLDQRNGDQFPAPYAGRRDIWISVAPQSGPPFWTGTQAEYTALATKDPHTLYVVTG
jgi:hypothetical protein